MDLSIEKEKHFQKPNFITSFVEESKLIDLKTLSDGLERGLENISETEKEEVEDEKEELHEVSDIMDGDCDSINHDPAAVREESETQIDDEFPKSERSAERKTDDEELGVAGLLGQMSGE